MSEDQFADLGAIEDKVDPESRFALQHQARPEAKKAFIHWTQVKKCSVHYAEVPNQSLKRTQKETLFALGGIMSQVRQHGRLHPAS